jgi:hypothetical protein
MALLFVPETAMALTVADADNVKGALYLVPVAAEGSLLSVV